MTLEQIYIEFTPGSRGFAKAVSSWCGYDMSWEEIERIGKRAATAEEFDRISSEEEWWLDKNN